MKKIVLLFVTVMFGMTVYGQVIKNGVKSFMGQKAPEIVVEEWLGEKSDTKGKFVLLEFWGVNCNPCREAIPHLNDLHKKFKQEMAIVSMCYDNKDKINNMKVAVQENGRIVRWEKPTIEYPVAIDTKKTTQKAFELIFVPYAVVMDSEGIVRWEGSPAKLTEEVLRGIIDQYKKTTNNAGNKEGKRLWAKSILNQKAPRLKVEKWLNGEPDVKGKFMLIDFWGLSCAPCRKAIPELNEYSKKFKKDLVVIGIASCTEEKMNAANLSIEYYNAIDTEKTMQKKLEVTGVPHIIIVDPEGIVRWEGFPYLQGEELTEEVIENLIQEYKKPGYIKGQVDVTTWNVKSYLNQKAPQLVFGDWITEKPDTTGKFLLFEMYGLFCPPCWKAVPKLNVLHKKFRKEMTIVGVTNTEGKLPQEPHADYYKSLDKTGVTRNELGLRFVPYALLIDRSGIVRWEVDPNDLTEEIVKQVIKKYKK